MNTNRIPSNVGGVFALAETVVTGLNGHGENLLLPANMSETLTNQRDEARLTDQDYLDQKAGLGALRRLRREKRAAVAVLITNAMGVLRPHLGKRWTSAWDELGLHNGRVRIPNRHADRSRLLSNIQAHLVAHPERELPSAGITAAAAGALHAELTSLESQIRQKSSQVGARRELRGEQLEKLSAQLRLVRGALEQAFANDDPRWQAFGFVRPDFVGVPERPQAVVLQLTGTMHRLSWQPAPRAERYRLFAQKPGETEPVFLQSAMGTEALLEGLVPGAKVTVTAANDAGESTASEPAVVGEVATN